MALPEISLRVSVRINAATAVSALQDPLDMVVEVEYLGQLQRSHPTPLTQYKGQDLPATKIDETFIFEASFDSSFWDVTRVIDYLRSKQVKVRLTLWLTGGLRYRSRCFKARGKGSSKFCSRWAQSPSKTASYSYSPINRIATTGSSTRIKYRTVFTCKSDHMIMTINLTVYRSPAPQSPTDLESPGFWVRSNAV